MIRDMESAEALGFEEAVKSVKLEIDKTLSGSHELIRKYLSHLKASSGKLIRARSLIICAMDAEDKVSPNAVKLAAAIEIFHLATLVHDDIIDDAQMRRGKASLQKKFGRKLAVICGDYLFSIALKLLNDIKNKEEYLDIDMPDFISRVCIGELDQHINNMNVDLTLYRYLKIISGKTAALFEACFYGGAILGGADTSQAKKYMKAGRYIGMIFQLNDDCMDFEETEDTARKTVQSDYEQGVITLPLIYAFTKKPELKNTALKLGLTKDQAFNAVIGAGGLGFTRLISERYYNKCIKVIDLINMNDSKREKLISVLNKAFYGLKSYETIFKVY